MLDTMAGICGYTEIQCIWSKSGYNEIQSWLNSMSLALYTIRYNVSGPSLDTMDTNLTSRKPMCLVSRYEYVVTGAKRPRLCRQWCRPGSPRLLSSHLQSVRVEGSLDVRYNGRHMWIH